MEKDVSGAIIAKIASQARRASANDGQRQRQ